MQFKFIFSILALLQATIHSTYGQKLVAGPFQGATSPGEMKVWLMTKKEGDVRLTLTNKQTKEQTSLIQTTHKGTFKSYAPYTFHFNNLDSAGKYSWTVSTKTDTIYGNTQFEIASEEITDFSFLIGSCAVRIPRLFHIFHPGIEDKIYLAMIEKESDFMVWLGDNLYYKSRQMSDSYKSMEVQYVRQRLIPELNAFMMSRGHYATWDDHDYGPNDSDGNFENKQESLAVFKNYWPNTQSGLPDARGVYFNFKEYDAEFFMMDNRYHRTEKTSESPTLLGQVQLEWLKQVLLKSTATFKFIVVGNQVFSPVNPGDSYQDYPEELNGIMRFIDQNKISGVIFLSGDRHHTELLKRDDVASYPIYEFTNSALTSIGIPPNKSKEKVNPMRVENTMVFDNNFGRISIRGPKGERICTMETFNNTGELLWEFHIPQKELSYTK